MVHFGWFVVYYTLYREEELQLEKRKKRKIKGNSRLSFAEDIDNGSEEDEGESSKLNLLLHLTSLITFQTFGWNDSFPLF